ncbi:MAG: hypothetical protein V4793_19665 [Paraburkholderia tropica]|uniref:hypothetical protein n=1 Tax=Paraburkholderia tropica TaxID=92647 RepID=UPI003100CCE8
MRDYIGSEQDRRGNVIRIQLGESIQAWRYRVMRSRPMIKWSTSCLGSLNGNDYVFAITQSRRGRCYAYFKWVDELIFFCTGVKPLVDGEAVEYRPADDCLNSMRNTESPSCKSVHTPVSSASDLRTC